ncbi:MAG: methyl viologen-reducing hydrogenase [Chitinivibrionales bacterium]|nr:methyl viologen-reducing hydrogenase [Chitinivibrionales bacterium]
MKIKISTEWLSGCSGCHVAVVDLHEKLINLTDSVEFVRVPVLMDEREYPRADVGIVEGAIRSEHDRAACIKMRESVKTLIAFGTCAVYGGPSGVGWLYRGDSVLEKAYGAGMTNAPGEWPDSNAPKLEQSVVPIDEIVTVDRYLPGCPPHPYWIASAITGLLSPEKKSMVQKTVCSRCERTMKKVSPVALQKGNVTAADDTVCFLSQGVVCMGSVTMERCLAQCPNKGVACSGCAGPSTDIITEPHLDMRTMIARRMSMLTGIEEQEIRQYIEDEARTYYAYAMASPVMYKKPAVKIREWAQ